MWHTDPARNAELAKNIRELREIPDREQRMEASLNHIIRVSAYREDVGDAVGYFSAVAFAAIGSRPDPAIKDPALRAIIYGEAK